VIRYFWSEKCSAKTIGDDGRNFRCFTNEIKITTGAWWKKNSTPNSILKELARLKEYLESLLSEK
jgi:hypothetical protein